MTSDTVRVGIVGLGRISSSHIQEFQACAGAEVVALCDIDTERIAATELGARCRPAGVGKGGYRGRAH